MKYGTDYEVANRQITFTTAPVGMLYVYRETPTDRMVQFMEGSVLKATDMNISTLQQLHIIEENEDWTISNSIVIDDEDNTWEGRNLRIKNIADPLNAQDVVTKHYMETVQDGFVQENTKLKDEATKQANIATQQAQLATEKATTATQQANRAQAWAESPSSPDGEPDSKSSKTWAEEAVTSASLAAGSASTATTQAGIATAKADEAASSAASALSSKNTAATSASNAATSESNAAKSESAAATSASNAAISESNAASSAQKAAEVAVGIGNPVSDVTENNGTITITKNDGTQSSFEISIASEAEAKAGTNNTKHMTPLRVAQAIEALDGNPITGASISGKIITLTKKDGSKITLTTQDTAPFTGRATTIGGASVTKPAVIVETYQSGDKWYRIWSDGWIEQGASVLMVSGGVQTNLLKPYANTNWAFIIGQATTDSENAVYAFGKNKTATGLLIIATANGGHYTWYACGKGA